jgi:hypothetical protein
MENPNYKVKEGWGGVSGIIYDSGTAIFQSQWYLGKKNHH